MPKNRRKNNTGNRTVFLPVLLCSVGSDARSRLTVVQCPVVSKISPKKEMKINALKTAPDRIRSNVVDRGVGDNFVGAVKKISSGLV